MAHCPLPALNLARHDAPVCLPDPKTACPVFRGSRIRLLIPRHWLERLSAPHSSVTVRYRQRCRTARSARAPWNKWKGPATAMRWREGGRLCRERPLRSTRAALRFARRLTDECRHADRCRGHASVGPETRAGNPAGVESASGRLHVLRRNPSRRIAAIGLDSSHGN